MFGVEKHFKVLIAQPYYKYFFIIMTHFIQEIQKIRSNIQKRIQKKENTKKEIMGANITDSQAFNLYTANGGTTGKYSVNWDENKNKCFAKFTVKPLEGSSESVTVQGEALGFLKTSIDTRVYFIKNF